MIKADTRGLWVGMEAVMRSSSIQEEEPVLPKGRGWNRIRMHLCSWVCMYVTIRLEGEGGGRVTRRNNKRRERERVTGL
jgi:hypothetical protein